MQTTLLCGVELKWHFDSLEEIIEYGTTRKIGANGHHVSQTDQNVPGDYHSKGWFGTDSWESAVDLATHGWSEGIEAIEKIKNKLGIERLLNVAGLTEVEEYDVSGSYVDIGLYLEGDPECMITTEETRAKNPRTISMFLNMSASAVTTPAKMVRRGAAAGAVLDILEHMGIQVEVFLLQRTNYDANGVHTGACKIKRAGELFDKNRMAFALTNPAMFRRFWFAVKEELDFLDSGYGTPMSVRADELPADSIVIETYTRDRDIVWESDDTAAAWCREQIERFL